MDNVGTKKFCGKCGMELLGDAVFCPRCGEKWVSPTAAVIEAITEDTPTAPLPQTAPTPQGTSPVAPTSAATPIQQYNANIAVKNSHKLNIDWKKTILKNIAAIICFIVGIVLLIKGLSTSVPSSHISFYGLTEYVNGDAYNYIIESALRGSRIVSAQVVKALYITVGALISCIAVLKIELVKAEKEAI